ncbi:Fucolectin-4 [Bagarius yarrelli]|uniref:Fucolectin-4 n=1 Tax=Bagarius yarrelli TaxID=175774 RepID=A0A556V7Z2_BAGYA|nr:Fucolectin-4 [Bagarius yarrelli]
MFTFSPLVNLALRGTATQSSITGSNYHAKCAIDGNKASNILSFSCTHTQFETDPWWRVELLAVYNISSVVITNRGDCCSDRINGAEIRIGYNLENNGNNNPRCVTITSIPAGATRNFTCHMIGRHVNIFFPGVNRVATLCEVEVYGVPVNLALKGTASQSSNYESKYYASFAIDGTTSSDFSDMSCACTNNEMNPWWEVDLLAMYDISNVSITTRGDCCPERINGAEIHIGNVSINSGTKTPSCAVAFNIPAGASVHYSCNMRGRYVTISIPNVSQFLTLCEVEVYGVPVNLALNGVARQSSTHLSIYSASIAIDGNKGNNITFVSCTHTNLEFNPWWELDLLKEFDIGTVIITNRADCCPERLTGSELYIGNSSITSGYSNPRQYLTLCEVEVYQRLVNVARKGIATQSSTFTSSYPASRAIDGNRASILSYYSCTHTAGQVSPWWRVDLLAVHDISNVIVTNRGDACAERLNGAEIRIGNSLLNNGNINPR